MSVTWMYLICVSVMMGSTYGNTGTDTQKPCPVKCDVIQELSLIRQLLNQESLLRVNTNNEIQELKKTLRRSITSMQNNQRATKQDLTTLETSVTAIRNDNTAARGDLTTLERIVTSMNQTYQGKYVRSSDIKN